MEKPIRQLLEFCIINVDKPSGLTSFQVCERIRKIFNAKKAGHFGTLDPKVTGVLPIALNRACRLSNYFMKRNKEYVGKMYLHSDISEKDLKEHMQYFIGKILQKPPVKSRVKRVFRERVVDEFNIIKKQNRIVEFRARVQAGTYIRKLISDLGEKVGGAHMIELRRTRAGIFSIEGSKKIEEIEKAFEESEKGKESEIRKILIPAEIIQEIIERLDVKDQAMQSLLNGKPLMKGDLLKEKIPDSELFSVFNKDRLVGIYRKNNKDGILALPEFVLTLNEKI